MSRYIVVSVMRFCEICGVDISDRGRSDARYCKECYIELNRQRSFYRWEHGLGTTAMGQHTKIKRKDGKVVGIDKEYRIIENELKRLGLKRYIRKSK